MESCELQGPLERLKGLYRKRWAMEWYAIQHNFLIAFASHQCSEVKKAIALATVTEVTSAATWKDPTKFVIRFAVTSPATPKSRREFSLRSETHEEMDRWIEALQQAVQRSKEAAQGPPVAAGSDAGLAPTAAAGPVPLGRFRTAASADATLVRLQQAVDSELQRERRKVVEAGLQRMATWHFWRQKRRLVRAFVRLLWNAHRGCAAAMADLAEAMEATRTKMTRQLEDAQRQAEEKATSAMRRAQASQREAAASRIADWLRKRCGSAFSQMRLGASAVGAANAVGASEAQASRCQASSDAIMVDMLVTHSQESAKGYVHVRSCYLRSMLLKLVNDRLVHAWARLRERVDDYERRQVFLRRAVDRARRRAQMDAWRRWHRHTRAVAWPHQPPAERLVSLVHRLQQRRMQACMRQWETWLAHRQAASAPYSSNLCHVLDKLWRKQLSASLRSIERWGLEMASGEALSLTEQLLRINDSLLRSISASPQHRGRRASDPIEWLQSTGGGRHVFIGTPVTAKQREANKGAVSHTPYFTPHETELSGREDSDEQAERPFYGRRKYSRDPM
ncbi:unnamed protein product [Vitrella brassicaformis CCMP3155]|uniref:PH domain-containing protein n=2 Tax=Vitrella brassicaformis TaxID=1169539 RepID=A0A0G4ENG7_VITBC|nr:unnamed protein product [Vitrella brassicaformis CCMP3155]|eukprot:CEL99393.1 unnamed protein product [Vitrella brassicaformis CCMP3155]